jgi:hypothetical protein
MEASVQKETREYVISQTGPIVKELLNLLYRVRSSAVNLH